VEKYQQSELAGDSWFRAHLWIASSGDNMQTYSTRSRLSLSRQQLLENMQEISFATIAKLSVVNAAPYFDPLLSVIRVDCYISTESRQQHLRAALKNTVGPLLTLRTNSSLTSVKLP
jgi:hypothetical protein